VTPEEAALVRSIRRGRTIRFVALGAVFAMPIVYVGYRIAKGFYDRREAEAELAAQFELSGEQRAELEAIAHGTPAKIQAASAAWKTAVTRDALAKIEASDDQRCSVPFDGSLIKLDAKDAIPDNPDLVSAAREVTQLQAALEADEVNTGSLARAHHILARGTVIFVVDAKDAPQSGGDVYMPGGVAGRAYLFSNPGGKIACAADVTATSSAEIKIEYEYDPNNPIDETVQKGMAARQELERDLDRNLRGRIDLQLRAVP
jgi:hypothetical protein